MKRSTVRFILAALALVAAVAAVRSVVIVDQAEVVYVTEFGRPVRLLTEPGLHAKWPHQSRRGFDRRLQVDAPPPREMLTQDKKNLQVAWSVSWAIEDVNTFLSSVRTMPDATARLEDLAASVLAAELGRKDLSELVSVGETSSLEALVDDARRRIAEQAGPEYGLKVVDVQLRRLNYPTEVREAVFEQIRSERRRVAAATRAEGESQARQIRSAADLERAKRLAEAEADAARTVGEGEAAATRIANEAHAADPDFYRFLTMLETYRAALDERTTLVLSSESPFLKLLIDGLPGLNAPPGPAPSSPGLAGDGQGDDAATGPVGGASDASGPDRRPRRRGGGVSRQRPAGDPPGRNRRRPPLRRRPRRAGDAGVALGPPARARPRRPAPGEQDADPDRRRRRHGRRPPLPAARPRGRRRPDRRPEPRDGPGDVAIPGRRPRPLPLRGGVGRRGPDADHRGGR